MVEVVGVRFRESGHVYYYLPADGRYEFRDRVLVDNKKSKQLAEVVYPSKTLAEADVPDELKPIIKHATVADIEKAAKNEEDAKEAFKIAKKKISQHELEMKLIHAEYAFDRSKLIFQFTADGRIDFRNLVKDLAAAFKTRIELRQIGIRDEAKILGGIGPCGRQLCCSTFLGDFIPVSIKMAKDQNLSLNQTKISGLCGRLMCCLKYENDTYAQAKREMPDYGKEIDTPEGRGRVVGLNLLDRVVKVRLLSKDGVIDFEQDELKDYQASKKITSGMIKEDSNG
ncbi:stage 0 sporulation family protein [Vagococcus coleopterorum]|uniref:Stage 0 sporulation family protein n=1 Tax=Vagococcus coleopterorum TaxID=2714946 RepID=A0A6G8AMR5_9ENTE|nr:stage 0 sporulation family protein [Vagococcus coleopterorum]QIL46358.1 stage 0 sporulation family protein [Vagococcus coleopterorum]